MKAQIKTGRRENERGFALLVVFLVAAGIMISLYMEIPRVAFESQRNREEMLIERGEQYSRAIEVFYRKNKRYPQKIEDLESFNNMRFLRKRYVDPLTGKDEWRMVHMGPAGQLADSLVEKPGQMPGQQLAGNGQPGANGQAAPGQPGVTGTGTPPVPGAPPDPADVDMAKNRMRPSDRNPANRGGAAAWDPNNPNAPPQQPPVDANGNPITDPNQLAALNNANNPGFNPNQFNPNNPTGQPQNPNLPQNGQFPQNGFPQPNFPGQAPAFPNQPGINPGGVQPGQNGYYQNGQPFNPGAQLGAQNGQNPNQPGFGQNPALNAINNQLRNQNNAFGSQTGGQSGFNNSGSGFNSGNTTGSGFGANNGSGFNNPTSTSGFGTPVQTSQMSNSTMGGAGIAGVASNQIGVGIKVYNDRKKYKEWEFIFDYRKPKTKPTTGVTGTPPNGLNSSSGFSNTPSTTPPPPSTITK